MLRLPRVTAVLATGLLFTAACGGSSKPAAKATDNSSTGQQTSSSSSSSSGSSQSSSSAGGGTGIPGSFADAQYQQGTGHVEISGGKSASADFTTASGLTTQGHVFITFADADNTSSLIVTISKVETETGIVANVNGLATGGQVGEKCTLDISKNDASELAGSFTCTGVDGVSSGEVLNGNLNVKGSFSAKA